MSRVNGIDSENGNIEVRIPQSSCHGPLLLMIYINDPPQAAPDYTVSMYADDTSLMTQLNEAINRGLTQIDTWQLGNKLSLNVAKSQFMLVSIKSKHNILKYQTEHLELKIREQELQCVQKTEYLEVEIDCFLDWKKQIKAITTKVSRALGFLKQAKSF